jgi:hypothetical protein
MEDRPSITLGKPRQSMALAKKALSYQKRQTFTNVCCISLCPIIMVGISGYLGWWIKSLILRGATVTGNLYFIQNICIAQILMA